VRYREGAVELVCAYVTDKGNLSGLCHFRFVILRLKLCLTLREEHRLKVLQNRLLKKIFVSNWDEATGGWRKIHNEKLHDFYVSPDIIRVVELSRLKWVGHGSHMGNK
jgi:hypothetical protein